MPYKDEGMRRAYAQNYHQRHWKQEKARMKAFWEALFAEALRMLGSKCACPGCGVSETAFLTVDHMKGRRDRKRVHRAVIDAKASGWDKTKFQILCWNCNCAKRDRGFCPVHETDPGQNNGSDSSADSQASLWSLMFNSEQGVSGDEPA